MPWTQMGEVKKFPPNYDISLNMKKEERRSFFIFKLIQSDE